MGDQRREASLTLIKKPPVFPDKTLLDFKWLAMFHWFFMFDSRWLMIYFQFWTETDCFWQSIRVENDFRQNISIGFFRFAVNEDAEMGSKTSLGQCERGRVSLNQCIKICDGKAGSRIGNALFNISNLNSVQNRKLRQKPRTHSFTNTQPYTRYNHTK